MTNTLIMVEKWNGTDAETKKACVLDAYANLCAAEKLQLSKIGKKLQQNLNFKRASEDIDESVSLSFSDEELNGLFAALGVWMLENRAFGNLRG